MIVAIDGYSSCGKSTLAKEVARRLKFTYIDTGAMYRAVALYFLQEGISTASPFKVIKPLLSDIHISFAKDNSVRLQGEKVEAEIRSLRVSEVVSSVAALGPVRDKMVALQRQLGEQGDVVMDGRDIGTVVFPYADIKVFMTAAPKVRAERRYKELSSKGEKVTPKEVMNNIKRRDRQDTTRSINPLVQAKDAWLLDNTSLSIEETVSLVLDKVQQLRKEQEK